MLAWYLPGDVVYPTVVCLARTEGAAIRKIAKKLLQDGYGDLLTDMDAPEVLPLTKDDPTVIIRVSF